MILTVHELGLWTELAVCHRLLDDNLEKPNH